MVKRKYNCPGELTVSLIDGKWKVILLYLLRRNARRFGELRRQSPGINQATLARELKRLEDDGLVRRTPLGRDRLSGVEYSLTERGESLKPIVAALIRWGVANQGAYAAGEFAMAQF